MNKINLKNFYLNLLIILIVFIFDRITKLYILKLAEVETSVDIYITPLFEFILNLEQRNSFWFIFNRWKCYL